MPKKRLIEKKKLWALKKVMYLQVMRKKHLRVALRDHTPAAVDQLLHLLETLHRRLGRLTFLLQLNPVVRTVRRKLMTLLMQTRIAATTRRKAQQLLKVIARKMPTVIRIPLLCMSVSNRHDPKRCTDHDLRNELRIGLQHSWAAQLLGL